MVRYTRVDVRSFELLQVKTYVAERLSQTLRISPELEAKNSLLKSKPTLYQLYKDLVTTSIITAEEFWASHTPSHTSNQDTGKGHQEGGLPSAFLVSVAMATECL